MKRNLMFVLLLALAAPGRAEDKPAILSDIERLRAVAVVAQIDKTSAEMELLALRHQRLQETQQNLARELARLGDEFLQARKLDLSRYYLDWRALEVKQRPPEAAPAAKETEDVKPAKEANNAKPAPR